jgi:hypothetical protein
VWREQEQKCLKENKQKSEGEEEKKHNAINNEEERKLNGSIIEFKPFEGPKLMIDSKWEWQRREFQQKNKERKERSEEELEQQKLKHLNIIQNIYNIWVAISRFNRNSLIE